MGATLPGRALGMKLVVKRVETRGDALTYRSYGVDFAQSQGLSPAEPLDAVLRPSGKA